MQTNSDTSQRLQIASALPVAKYLKTTTTKTTTQLQGNQYNIETLYYVSITTKNYAITDGVVLSVFQQADLYRATLCRATFIDQSYIRQPYIEQPYIRQPVIEQPYIDRTYIE